MRHPSGPPALMPVTGDPFKRLRPAACSPSCEHGLAGPREGGGRRAAGQAPAHAAPGRRASPAPSQARGGEEAGLQDRSGHWLKLAALRAACPSSRLSSSQSSQGSPGAALSPEQRPGPASLAGPFPGLPRHSHGAAPAGSRLPPHTALQPHTEGRRAGSHQWDAHERPAPSPGSSTPRPSDPGARAALGTGTLPGRRTADPAPAARPRAASSLEAPRPSPAPTAHGAYTGLSEKERAEQGGTGEVLTVGKESSRFGAATLCPRRCRQRRGLGGGHREGGGLGTGWHQPGGEDMPGPPSSAPLAAPASAGGCAAPGGSGLGGGHAVPGRAGLRGGLAHLGPSRHSQLMPRCPCTH